jgi:hypothetical protein
VIEQRGEKWYFYLVYKQHNQPLYRRAVKAFKSASRYNLLFNRIKDESVRHEARWLYIVLDSYADKQGKPVHKPPLTKLLKRSGLGRTLFYEMRKVLIDLKWIEAIERIGADGKQLSTEYHIMQDWTGIANCPVRVSPDDTTPVRVAAPLDKTHTTYFVEETPSLTVLPSPKALTG